MCRVKTSLLENVLKQTGQVTGLARFEEKGRALVVAWDGSSIIL